MTTEFCVLDSPEDVASATADLFVATANAAISANGRFAVALAGGNTPKAAYALLAEEPRRSALDWKVVHVFFGDERCVPPDDAQSNYRMAMDAFLQRCALPPEHIYRIRGELNPQDAAEEYAVTLREQLGDPPALDLALLGMGPDGHTASLFPGTDPLNDDAQCVRAVFAAPAQMWRVTMTPHVLNASRIVAFGIEGSAKASALAAVRNGMGTPAEYPAQIIAPAAGTLVFIVDKAAAADLS